MQWFAIFESDLFLLYFYTVIVSNYTNLIFRDGMNKMHDELVVNLKKMNKPVGEDFKDFYYSVCWIFTFVPIFNVYRIYKTMMYSLRK
jgi:hypothetical protein